MIRSRSLQGAADVPLSLHLQQQRGGDRGGARGRQRLHEGDTARSWVVVVVVLVVVVVVVLVQRVGRAVWVGTVLGGCPGDDVSAVVRARASILAEVELERLNLQHKGRKEKKGGGGERGREGRKKNDREKREKSGRGVVVGG